MLVFGVLAGLMIFQALKGGTAPVLLPSQLLARSTDTALSRVRVGGRVADNAPVEYKIDPPIELRFAVLDPGDTGGVPVPVVYPGLKPDMFSPGRDVIIDGEFVNGTIMASRLLTQCPSKYEPPLPAGEPASAESMD